VAGAGAGLAFDEHAFLLEVGHDACHGGARQPGASGNLGAARRSGSAQLRQDPGAVALAAYVGTC
jgi:hypothetical protein